MANDINRITLIGRIVRDPELKQLQSGSSVANFSVRVTGFIRLPAAIRKRKYLISIVSHGVSSVN